MQLKTVYDGDWSRLLCNGCYGYLLSLYQIRAGTGADHVKANRLSDLLFSLASAAEIREAQHRLIISDARAKHLSPKALRFIATAEYVAKQIRPRAEIEWSPPIIGLCKAFEAEVVDRVILPLANRTSRLDLTVDKKDRDIGRVASFCADQRRPSPELGTIAHFLQTVANSRQRRSRSNTILAFLDLASNWQGSRWILEPRGLHDSTRKLTTKYRNKAAHLHEMSESDYDGCYDLLLGSNGALLTLYISVQ